MKMNHTQAVEYLVGAIPTGLPTLLVGGPGIGKSTAVDDACKQLGWDLVISYPGLEDPTVPGGFPWAEKGADHATFLPFGNTARVLNATRPTVWFLDDFGQAPAATQAGYMPWILTGEVNGRRLPDHVTIIAASNRRTDRAGVSGILEPVKSRFVSIIELVADVDVWCDYAVASGFIPPEMIAFHRFKAGDGRDGNDDVGMLYRFDPSADLVNCPLPRTWANCARVQNLGLPPVIEAAAMMGSVGEAGANEYLAFLRMFRELPSVDGIEADPDGAPIPTQTSVLYAVTTALATRVTEENFGRIVRYAERLNESAHGDFAALLLRDCSRRCPAVLNTPEFAVLMSGELGQIIGGVIN